MPTWLWVSIIVIFVHIIVVFIATPPEAAVRWFLAKFEIHPELSLETTTVSVNGEPVEGLEKSTFIEEFNRATFVERFGTFGPVHSGEPVMMDAKSGDKTVQYLLYTDGKYIDVIKRSRNKTIAYRLLSRSTAIHNKISSPPVLTR